MSVLWVLKRAKKVYLCYMMGSCFTRREASGIFYVYKDESKVHYIKHQTKVLKYII